jgi:hypothetical protein
LDKLWQERVHSNPQDQADSDLINTLAEEYGLDFEFPKGSRAFQTQEQLIRRLETDDSFYGFIQCSVQIPRFQRNMREYFKNFQPIIKVFINLKK